MNKIEKSWPFVEPRTKRSVPARHVWLRLLETTDVHAHLLPYDYDRGQDVPGFGLARTATLIRDARAQAPNTLLFDNGDFLQGSALSDLAARPDSGWTGPHPVITAMNSLGYAAACLGNHEFNFGLDWLETALTQARFPVVCANAVTRLDPCDPSQDDTLVAPQALLPCALNDTFGDTQLLTIGVIGFLPPQITTWDHTHLHGRLYARDIVETARARVPQLRKDGADVIIALAHTGISEAPCRPGMENAALALAHVPGIDAVLAGHSHRVFPDHLAAAGDPRIDHAHGTLAGVPTVMAGFRGSHLGVLDLCLAKGDRGWRVRAHHAEARPVQTHAQAQPAPAEATLAALVRPAHDFTLEVSARPIGHTPHPLHSFLAKACPCPALAVVLQAKRSYLTDALRGTQHADLPVLAAAASFKTGGQAGPGYFTRIPAGPVSLRNLGDLYPFPNTLVGLRVTGADIVDWLERAASVFLQVQPGVTQQPLWNPEFAGHAFDTVAGLSYQIDLSRPARFDAQGNLLDPEARRICDLTFDNAPLHPAAGFALATNNFRAFGGGQYRAAHLDQVILKSQVAVRDLVAKTLRSDVLPDAAAITDTWRFAPMPGTSVWLDSSPELRDFPGDIRTLKARDLGLTQEGFLRVDIPL